MNNHFLPGRDEYCEALFAIGLTLCYCLSWSIAVSSENSEFGSSGFPLWFEWIALYLPLLFIVLCIIMVRYYFHNFSLDD